MELETFFEQFELLADAPNGVQKLRELILQLAVQRKLVPLTNFEQNSREISKGKRVSDFITILNGYAFKSQWFIEDGIRLLRNANVGHGTLRWDDVAKITEERAEEFKRFKLDVGDIVISLDRPLISTGLKVARVSRDDLPCLLLQRVGKVEFKTDEVIPEFFFLWLNSPIFINAIDPGRSNGVPHISSKNIESLPFAPPPKEEQERIIAKVDRLMSLCDELEARQEKRRDRILQLGEVATSQLLTPSTPEAFNQHWQGICNNFDLLYSTPENVSQLRQAILQLAVMGKLVPQDANDEPASVLLERIKEEKARLIKEGKIRKSEKLSPIKVDELPYVLPDSWQWVRFGEILLEITSGWSPMCEKHPKEDEEWGVLKVSAVSWDKFNPDENKALPSNLKPRPDHEVRSGDFLMSRANTSALVGKSVIVENTPERLLLSDKILRVYFSTFADKKFFNIYNNSLAARAYYSKAASGTSDSMRNISRIQILNLPVPVPPFQEQKRIFVKINQFMSLCDELEAKLTQSINDREKLMETAVHQVLAA